MQKQQIVIATVLSFLSGAVAQAAVVSGNIEVYNGAILMGYVSRIYDSQNSYTYTTSVADALVVQVDTADLTAFSLTASDAPGVRPLVGAVGGGAGFYMSSGNLGYAYLSGVGETSAGSPPSYSAGHDIQALGYNAPSESAIWSITGQTMTAQWVNIDGTITAAQTFYDPQVDFLGILGDFAAYNTAFPDDGAHAVTFVFTGALVPEPNSVTLLVLGGCAAVLCSRKLRYA